jgi:putative CocE/NonD family hydrolase
MLFVVALAAAVSLVACSGPDRGSARVERDVPVAMRDGTVLRADVWRPWNGGTFPVLVYRTPYGKHNAAEAYTTHLRAVERGYAVVIQDVRGRHASEGEFEPYRNEGLDGYDTIEWAAHQPWSNGKVGTSTSGPTQPSTTMISS